MGGVDSTEDKLAAGAGGIVAVEPEGEHRLRHQPLLHHVLEWRCHSPDADLREGQPLRMDERMPHSATERKLNCVVIQPRISCALAMILWHFCMHPVQMRMLERIVKDPR